MKIGVDIRIIKDAEGKRGLRVAPEIEGTDKALTYFAALVVAILAAASLWAIAATPDPEVKPSVNILGGF
jgi:hypothetical protein